MNTPTSAASQQGDVSNDRPAILSIHHPAFRCFDAEQSRKFYEDVLGIGMKAVVLMDDDGFGNKIDFVHIFHRMTEGDFVAFFDVVDKIAPEIFSSYGPFDLRVGLKVAGEEDLNTLAQRLSRAGVDFVGPVDHGFMKSIYFKDPNGLNLEIAAIDPEHDSLLAQEKMRAKENLASWTAKRRNAH